MTAENMDVDLDDVSFDDVEADEEDETPAKPNGAVKSAKKGKTAKPAKAAAKSTEKKATKPAKTEKKATKAPAKAAKATKGEKTEKKARAPKSGKMIDPKTAKAEGLIKLDDKGRDLPFKDGSMMRYALEQALEPGGVTEKALEKEVVKLGYDYKLQRSVIMSGESGNSSLRPYPSTHRWDAVAKDGRIFVSNVKRIAFYHKMPRLESIPKKKKAA